MSTSKHGINMCEGSILPKILLFALPLIASSILQLLFNAADMVIAGHCLGANALAAVGSTSSLINLIVNVFLGLSVGTNVLVARFYGSKRHEDVFETVHTSVLLSLVCGVLLAFIGIFFAPKILVLMGTPNEILPLAVTYIRIYFLGMPVSMLYNFASAILRAIGDTLRPLIILTAAGFLNLFCNIGFIIIFKMGIEGVAYATVLSQALSALLLIICLARSDDCYKLHLNKLHINPDKFLQILRLGLPAGIQGAIFSISNVLIQSSVNSFGASVVAGNTAAQNIEGFVYCSMNALHHTCLSFTGQNYGAKKFDRIRKVAIECLGLVTAIGLCLGFVVFLFSPKLLGIYASANDLDVVIKYGYLRLSIIMTTYFTCGTMDVLVGSIRGLGYSILPTIVSLLGACGLRILWIFTIFAGNHDLKVLYISYPVSWTITTLAHLICFILIFRKLKRTFEEGFGTT